MEAVHSPNQMDEPLLFFQAPQAEDRQGLAGISPRLEPIQIDAVVINANLVRR